MIEYTVIYLCHVVTKTVDHVRDFNFVCAAKVKEPSFVLVIFPFCALYIVPVDADRLLKCYVTLPQQTTTRGCVRKFLMIL